MVWRGLCTSKLQALEGDAFDETLRELRLTSLYAHRIQRAIEKNRAELKSMQSERKAAYEKAQEEAILLTQVAYAKGQTVDAAKDSPPLNAAVGSSIQCPKSCASSTAKPAWRRPKRDSWRLRKWRRPPDLRKEAVHKSCSGSLDRFRPADL
jgi:hypothetical protein